MAQVTVFSDQCCTHEIDATYTDESGHNGEQRDGSAAFDNDPNTLWRPQCPMHIPGTCDPNVAWVTFSTTKEAKCVKANNLGFNEGDHKWNGGIVVELQNSDNSWTKAMGSDGGNSAMVAEGISLNLVFKSCTLLMSLKYYKN